MNRFMCFVIAASATVVAGCAEINSLELQGTGHRDGLEPFPFEGLRDHQVNSLTMEAAERVLRQQLLSGEALEAVSIRHLPQSRRLLLQGSARSLNSVRLLTALEDGLPLPRFAIELMEETARRKNLGKLSNEVLAATSMAEELDVEIFVRAPMVARMDLLRHANSLELEDAVAVERDRIGREIRLTCAPLQAQLRAHGAFVIHECDMILIIHARVPSVLLRSRVINDGDLVSSVDFPGGDGKLNGYAGHGALGELAMTGGGCGGQCDGGGLAVAIWEGSNAGTLQAPAAGLALNK